ncbi:hypothetical protein K2X92_05260 [Candidatus Gracilibacteria bacterium]|nr:hypothetical protein [Candidatus Gracilibacteria bacterium]
MRARILAVIILVIFLIIPITLYWYLTTQKIATVSFTVPSQAEFSVKMVGTFGVDGLPLADTVLFYEKTCVSTCVIGPILPAKYSLTIASKDKISITDDISVDAGANIEKSYTLLEDVPFSLVGQINADTSSIENFINNAKNNNLGDYKAIGIDIKNRVWVWRSTDSSSQIGILTLEKFSPIKNTNTILLDARMDETRSVIIASVGSEHLILMPIDLSDEKEIIFSSSDIVSVVPGDTWKLKTNTTSIELRGDRFIEDIRFSDSIDISPDIRLGYIDQKDTKKLSLSNLPSGKSVLIRLDRKTGNTIIIKDGVDIKSFFYFNKKPAYIDTVGNIFLLDINK